MREGGRERGPGGAEDFIDRGAKIRSANHGTALFQTQRLIAIDGDGAREWAVGFWNTRHSPVWAKVKLYKPCCVAFTDSPTWTIAFTSSTQETGHLASAGQQEPLLLFWRFVPHSPDCQAPSQPVPGAGTRCDWLFQNAALRGTRCLDPATLWARFRVPAAASCFVSVVGVWGCAVPVRVTDAPIVRNTSWETEH